MGTDLKRQVDNGYCDMQSNLSVNVGCGGGRYAFKDLGCSINCDIEKPRQMIPNFVVCNAQYLPFRDKCFKYSYASHLIEHLPFPGWAIAEMRRVSNVVVLKYPHFLSPNAYIDKTHKWVIVDRKFLPIPAPFHARTFTLLLFKFERLLRRKFEDVETKMG